MSSAQEAANEYKLTLDELVNNNKTQINLLTILAEDYQQHAGAIVETIEKQIYAVPKAQKLPIMYDLFAKIIVRVFLHVFLEGDEVVRSALYRLRQTWGDIFNRSKLYQLDIKVNEVDRAWPLTALKQGAKPPVITNPASSTASTTTVTLANKPIHGKVHVNPKFIQNNGQNTASDVSRKGAKSDGSKRVRFKTEDLKEPKKELIDELLELPPVRGCDRVIKIEPDEPTPPAEASLQSSKRKGAPPDSSHVDLKRRRSPPKPHDEDLRALAAYANKDGVVKPTPILGSHAFTVQAKSSLNRAQQQLPLQGRSSPVSNGLPVPAVHVPQHPATGSGLPMPPTFHVPTTISNPGTLPMPPNYHPPVAPSTSTLPLPPNYAVPAATVTGPGGLPMPPNYVPPTATTATSVPIQAPQARGPSSFPMPPGYRPPTTSTAVPPASQVPSGSNAIITAEVPTKLDIPSNNRIFVDGKAHEVEYVNDIAVIERNGLPHKIFFAGTPRNVILDGVPHLLHFGESKAVIIDGQEHILRFGAPSRELYLNNFAFRGQFGGAPIVATINGRRHEIRLAGPAPDVKINPDPAYELTAELNRIRASKIENKPEPSLDPFNLLKKLQQSGFLKKPEPAPAPAPNPSTRDRLRHNNTMLRDTTPPIPSEHSVSVVERRSIPTAPLKEFNMRTLKIRYDTVVDALHEKQQNACPHCGQRMELRGERYERHLDWHVKRNLKTFEKTNSSRPWYASSKDWLKCEEDEESGVTAMSGTAETMEESVPVMTVSARETVNRNCVVCCEEFEEYCDEDDDGVWKLKDCVIVNNQTYHSGCVQDASLLDEASSQDQSDSCDIKSSGSRSVVEWLSRSVLTMSTLALLVEGSACAWGRLAVAHGSETINDVIRALISFANAYLSMSASNHLLLFAFANKIKQRFLYNSRRGVAADASTEMLNAIRNTLRESAQSDDDRVGSPLAAVLSQAICYLKRTERFPSASKDSAQQLTSAGRIVIVAMTVDFGTEHGPLMNLFFSAAKHDICVDVVSLVDSSPLLQQATDITGGIFLQVERPCKLLSSMMTYLLGEPSSRSLFPQPSLKEVDYRASCACHHELVSSGWVCSVCLSVLCQFMPICKACGAIFKVTLPRKAQKRKRKE
ncbi:hypothetical protein KIN20_005173 [Parelaphostrongylus tenuis]|uniref:General transcription factor IIH subunit 3 n=1 Tax=Parelaphostrongylus tenuis TaxID=148309 RepID=A0AAD5MIH1_PARTN|nr:hypothetical protein KIN20_005173 [Parelaphostrongylus tenuis]